jgi:polyisoprenyl-teichoic acid--peptidoglycan teichoic acid transferase
MAQEQKPYRVYRGGRVRGNVPLVRPDERRPDGRDGRKPPEPKQPKPGRKPRWGLRIGLGVAIVAVMLVVWLVASFLAFRGGVKDANDRVPSGVGAALTKQDGLLLSTSTQIALLGTDGDRSAARADARRSDSILIVRTDPGRHRLAYLSIPRDLRVDVPGHGPAKINAAFQLGGPALALRTIEQLTGLELNHVVMVDFDNFKSVIDALGGIDVTVPKPIVSNRFDCPYSTDSRCRQWEGWRFEKGKQHMDGRRALIYSRIRENRLDPGENDLTRGARQQAVLDAIGDRITSMGTFVRLPFLGSDLVKPLTTDLSAGQLAQLGWVKFRANDGRALHCRLGGEPSTIGGESVILGGEDNVAVLSMFTGRSAPQPPRPGSGTYGPGCAVGRNL